jgi:hypothetical protein
MALYGLLLNGPLGHILFTLLRSQHAELKAHWLPSYSSSSAMDCFFLAGFYVSLVSSPQFSYARTPPHHPLQTAVYLVAMGVINGLNFDASLQEMNVQIWPLTKNMWKLFPIIQFGILHISICAGFSVAYGYVFLN